MYRKCLFFDKFNTTLLHQILQETNPARIKSLGRRVRNYQERVWNEVRFAVMEEGLQHKFNQNLGLGDMLLSTGNRQLYEASNDKVWGIGYNLQDAPTTPISKYANNGLGKCLMATRSKLPQNPAFKSAFKSIDT